MTGELPSYRSLVVWVDDLDRAFPCGQTGSARLVLTQSTYLMQKWIDELSGSEEARLLATADEAALKACAPEAFASRGPWSRCELRRVGGTPERAAPEPQGSDLVESRRLATKAADPSPTQVHLHAAFLTSSPLERLESCRRAVALDPQSPAARLALASACMEQQYLDNARDELDEAARLAPDWEAVHYERGKLWLRYDDLERARDAFRRAGDLMPTWSAAFSNLGATLGELDRPDEALAAFAQALQHDPNGYTIHNNIGVVSRELGRLDDSEAAFRRVLALAPEFVFGYYNLGHTLFLQGRYREAVEAYGAGQHRDPERNARQASRLALARLAAGDPGRALADLRACWSANLPIDGRRDLLAEAREIVTALLAVHPDLTGGRDVAAAIEKEITALSPGSSRPP